MYKLKKILIKIPVFFKNESYEFLLKFFWTKKCKNILMAEKTSHFFLFSFGSWCCLPLAGWVIALQITQVLSPTFVEKKNRKLHLGPRPNSSSYTTYWKFYILRGLLDTTQPVQSWCCTFLSLSDSKCLLLIFEESRKEDGE